MRSSPVGLPSPERAPMTREDVSRLSDEELQALAKIISEESEKRERESARFAKGLKAKAMKRDPRCPECAAKLWRDGKGKTASKLMFAPSAAKSPATPAEPGQVQGSGGMSAMSNYVKLINNLDSLKLATFRASIDAFIDEVNGGKADLVDALC